MKSHLNANIFSYLTICGSNSLLISASGNFIGRFGWCSRTRALETIFDIKTTIYTIYTLICKHTKHIHTHLYAHTYVYTLLYIINIYYFFYFFLELSAWICSTANLQNMQLNVLLWHYCLLKVCSHSPFTSIQISSPSTQPVSHLSIRYLLFLCVHIYRHRNIIYASIYVITRCGRIYVSRIFIAKYYYRQYFHEYSLHILASRFQLSV